MHQTWQLRHIATVLLGLLLTRGAAQAQNLAGIWQFSYGSATGTAPAATLKILQSGNSLSGEWDSSCGSAQFTGMIYHDLSGGPTVAVTLSVKECGQIGYLDLGGYVEDGSTIWCIPGLDCGTSWIAKLVSSVPVSASTNSLNFSYQIGSGTAPAAQGVTLSSSSPLAFSAVTTGGSWFSVTPTTGATPAALIVSVNPTGLASGTHTGSIVVTEPIVNGQQSIPVTLTITGDPVTVTSVLNAGSLTSGPIAPGEIVAIKGAGLGPTVGISYSLDPNSGKVDSNLSGTEVLFGGVAAPILYASAPQINAIVPYEISGQSQLVMQVLYQGVLSAGVTLQVNPAAPAVFTSNATGSGQASAINGDGSINGPTNPAPAGSYVSVYLTGGGQTNPAGSTGSISGSVLKYSTQAVTATIGGQPATVTFAGAAPTFVDGVGQLNLLLAVNTPTGPAQPLVISVGGVPSPAGVTIAVK